MEITAERENPVAYPDRPLFLRGVCFDPADAQAWFNEVLPLLSTCTLVVSSTADVAYCGEIFGSAALPHIFNAITKVELPKFYWFSGVALNRHNNPYLQMCRNLPNLQELSLTFHTAGLTEQRWAERQVIALEAHKPAAAKERILLSLREVKTRYELEALFACGRLRRLTLNYIESEMVSYFCKVGSPLEVLQEIKAYLAHGFALRGMDVVIELIREEVETWG